MTIVTVVFLYEYISILKDKIKFKEIIFFNSYKNTKIDSYKYKTQENSEMISVLTYHRIVNDWDKSSYTSSSKFNII